MILTFYVICSSLTDDWRCDQYRWANQGVRRLPKREPQVKKSYFHIDTPKRPSSNFVKHAYQLVAPSNTSTVLIHYIGDEKEVVDFPHGNASNQTGRPHVRTCPSVLKSLQDVCKHTTTAKAYKSHVTQVPPPTHMPFVQILNGCANNWFTISTVGKQRTTVKVFDSANMFVSFRNKEEIAALLCTPEKSITLQFMNVHRQVGSNDCGLYSLAYATALCNGIDPTACIFDQEEMRPHFFKCIMASRVLTPFPILKQRRASSKPKKVEGISIYCHCRLPHKPEEPMIQCGHCKEWYHDTCEKVEEECWNSKAKWFCHICT